MPTCVRTDPDGLEHVYDCDGLTLPDAPNLPPPGSQTPAPTKPKSDALNDRALAAHGSVADFIGNNSYKKGCSKVINDIDENTKGLQPRRVAAVG